VSACKRYIHSAGVLQAEDFPRLPFPERDPREISSGYPATREYDGSRDELARAVNRSVPESRSDKLTFLSGNSVRRIDVITIESYRGMPMNRPLDIYAIVQRGLTHSGAAGVADRPRSRGIAAGGLIARCVTYAIPRNLARISPKSLPIIYFLLASLYAR